MRDYNWRSEWDDAHSASADGTAGTRAPSTGEIAMIPTPDAVRDALWRYDKLMEEWSGDSWVCTLAEAARAWLAAQEEMSAQISLIVRDVAELPGRTSPDDQPNMMMVTAEELESILTEHIAPLGHRAEAAAEYRRQVMTNHAELIARLRQVTSPRNFRAIPREIVTEAADALEDAIGRHTQTKIRIQDTLAQARRDECEACARIADDYQAKLGWNAKAIAAAIRLRSKGQTHD